METYIVVDIIMIMNAIFRYFSFFYWLFFLFCPIYFSISFLLFFALYLLLYLFNFSLFSLIPGPIRSDRKVRKDIFHKLNLSFFPQFKRSMYWLTFLFLKLLYFFSSLFLFIPLFLLVFSLPILFMSSITFFLLYFLLLFFLP